MIEFRAVFEVKVGRASDAVKAFKWVREQVGPLGDYRICYNSLGESHRISMERKCKDLADYEKWWAEWGAAYGALDRPKEWEGVIEGWKCREIWKIVE